MPYDGSLQSRVKMQNREIEIIKALDHPLVIAYIDDFNVDRQQPCIVTELAVCGDF